MNCQIYGVVQSIHRDYVCVECDAYISAQGRISEPSASLATCDLPPPHPICAVGDRIKLEYCRDPVSHKTGWVGSLVTPESVASDLAEKYAPLYDHLTPSDLQSAIEVDAALALAGLRMSDHVREIARIKDKAIHVIEGRRAV